MKDEKNSGRGPYAHASLPVKLGQRVDAFLKNNWMGFRSRAEYITAAVRDALVFHAGSAPDFTFQEDCAECGEWVYLGLVSTAQLKATTSFGHKVDCPHWAKFMEAVKLAHGSKRIRNRGIERFGG